MRQREVWWEEYKKCVSVCVCVSRDQLLATCLKLRETSVWKWEIKLTKDFTVLCHSAVEVFTLSRCYMGSLFVTNLCHATSQKSRDLKNYQNY